MLQTLITALLGLSALAYLLKRWWPSWQGLWRGAAAPAPSCGKTAAEAGVSAPASHCGQGCGQCGQGHAAPGKDHRVTVHRQPPH